MGWVNDTWDISKFAGANGDTDWDAVIDAEVLRRSVLSKTPEPYVSDGTFDTSVIPWFAWVKRFHLPEAEKANGRAAMVGYFLGYIVDLATGHGLVDQQASGLGKFAIFLTVLYCVVVRRFEDVEIFKDLTDESTFYDKQWQQSWEGVERPSETE